jgi:hypothetical protein
MPLAAADFDAFREAEATLRRDGRASAQLATLGTGATDLVAFMDRAASFQLTPLPARFRAAAASDSGIRTTRGTSSAGGRLAAPRNGIPPPTAPVLGTYLITTVGFSSAMEIPEYTGPDVCPCTKTETSPINTDVPDEVAINGNKGTITTTMTASATVNKSKVSMDITIKIDGEVRDGKTGALLYKVASQSTGHIDGDACPDASGTATAHMLFSGSEDYFDSNGAKTSSRVSESFGGEMRVRVDDNAKIAAVDIKPTGQGGEFMVRLAAQSIGPSMEKAWRSGMCIAVLVSPESGDVEKESDTSVVVKVKHKVEGNELDKPVEPKLDGVKTIDPTSKQKAPATYRYTAGPKDGDRGTITFESVSNRGVGHQVVSYAVAGGWTISLVGTSVESVAAVGSVNSTRISFTNVKVTSAKDNALNGSGEINVTGTFEAAIGDVYCSAPIARKFAFNLTGGVAGTGPAAVLKLKLSAPSPANDVLHLACDGVTIDVPQPGETDFFGFTLGEMELPAAGGTVSFDRSKVVALASVRATATVTVVPAKK